MISCVNSLGPLRGRWQDRIRCTEEDVWGEMPVKDKEGENRSGQGKPSNSVIDLRGQRRREGGLGKKSHTLQCFSKKISA